MIKWTNQEVSLQIQIITKEEKKINLKFLLKISTLPIQIRVIKFKAKNKMKFK
jgi:hypothetical protein